MSQTATADLFFGFEDNQSPDDFFNNMFFETCRSTDDSPEDLDSFKEFVLAFVSDGNLDPIHKGFEYIYQNKNIERISILVNSNCLNTDEKTKTLRILANTNKPISSLINVDNVSETIISLFNGGRETEAFELIEKYEVKKIDVGSIEKDTLNYLLRMTLNNFALIHIFVLLFNSSLEPVDMLFNFLEDNSEDIRLIDYFTTIQAQALKEYAPTIKQYLSKKLPYLKEQSQVDIYELVIQNLGINFNSYDDYKIGYYSVENTNAKVLSMLADNNYFTQQTLPEVIQACIKFDKPKLFTYLLNTYGDMLVQKFMVDSFTSVYNKEQTDYVIQSFDSFGVLQFLNHSTVVYKDFFNIYFSILKSFVMSSSHASHFNNIVNLMTQYFIENKNYLSILIHQSSLSIDLNFVVDYYYLKNDFDYIGTFIDSFNPNLDLGYHIELTKQQPLDETWYDFVHQVIFKNNEQNTYDFMSVACALRVQSYLSDIQHKEVFKTSLNNLVTVVNQKNTISIDSIKNLGYSAFATDVLNSKNQVKNLISEYISPNFEIIKILVAKRANLFLALNLSIFNKDVDSLLFCIANINNQNLKMNRITSADIFNNLLSISKQDNHSHIFAFEAFKNLWNSNLLNLKSITRQSFEMTTSNQDIYDFLISKNIYKDFDARNINEDNLFIEKYKTMNSLEDFYSYNKEKPQDTKAVVNKPKTKAKTQLQEEEDFSFMKKDRVEEKTFMERLFSTTLPYYIIACIIFYILYLLKLF